MKQGSLFITIFAGLIGLVVAISLQPETKLSKKSDCENVRYAPTNSSDEYDICYCDDYEIKYVWYDGKWHEPSKFEQRMIRMNELR